MQPTGLLVITLAHFCVDSYATMLVPALPFLTDRLGLDLTSAGVLSSVVAVCGTSQPLLGAWADRMGRRYLVLVGLALSAVFLPLMGLAPSYWTLVACLCLGGMGVAAFHPQSFVVAGELSGARRSFGLALFIFGGTLALGGTPVWVTWLGSQAGLGALPLVALPGLALIAVTVRVVPLDNPHLRHGAPPLRQSLAEAGRPLALITAIVVLRSVTGLAFGTFIPFLGQERGLDPVEWGLALSVYNTAGVVSGLVWGYLADRIRPRTLVWTALLASTPLLYGYLHTGGLVSYGLLAVGGGLLLSSSSVLVAMAQQLAPRNAALASSLPLGLSWGLASLFLGPLGYAAERLGLSAMLSAVALLPVLTAALALRLPRSAPVARPA